MKVYILIEQVFPQCEASYTEILGTYKNLWQAEEEKQKAISDNVNNFDFVRDEESSDNIFAIDRIFQGFQENWDNYIEYKIIKKEVM